MEETTSDLGLNTLLTLAQLFQNLFHRISVTQQTLIKHARFSRHCAQHKSSKPWTGRAACPGEASSLGRGPPDCIVAGELGRMVSKTGGWRERLMEAETLQLILKDGRYLRGAQMWKENSRERGSGMGNNMEARETTNGCEWLEHRCLGWEAREMAGKVAKGPVMRSLLQDAKENVIRVK